MSILDAATIPEIRQCLYLALLVTGSNRQRSATLLGRSREWVRQQIAGAGGDAGLAVLAANAGLAVGSAQDAKAALASKLSEIAKRSRGANLPGSSDSSHTANHHEINTLLALTLGSATPQIPIAMATQTSAAVGTDAYSSSVRVEGGRRSYLRRLQVELEERLGVQQVDMTEAVGIVFDALMAVGTPAEVALLLVEHRLGEAASKLDPGTER